MSKAPIEFFFDFASPYAYFAAQGLEEIAARHGRTVRWRPILLWTVLRSLGLPPPMESKAKGDYMRLDMDRSARFHGRRFRFPTNFPTSAHLPARAFYWLEAQDPEAAKAFARKAFTAFFVDDIDFKDAAAVAGIGVDETALKDEAATQALRAAGLEAESRGVYGSPFIFVDGEPFFGADRLPQIEWRLATAP
ncbi:2-hydroxychromene-2-carboxylate isomerase [Oleomonas cavernae]|uniref:2-hydroxychromene-2-carboxylate isomerase n=1 Tax=Oleomonas cavernae TaxID=2320859 RepID=A0A418WAZ4_9PROT|nr:2-hydroxychromene-2-carboxylate isomerase [Oleomonas cavernae]RJF87223.1 2-hydroxychromene-2-carboxylate isomerase [Oleomonas cavernae]